MSDYYAVLGGKIRTYREEAGLTQEELGRLLGHLSASTVSYFEKGVRFPKAEEIFKMAKIFDVPIEKLSPTDNDAIKLDEDIVKFRKSKESVNGFDYEKLWEDLDNNKNINSLKKNL